MYDLHKQTNVQIIMSIKIPRIELSAKLKGQLAEKYSVTTQAIRNALK